MAQIINEENFETLVKNGTPTVIDFWATWCGPCKRLAPIVEQLAEEYAGRVDVCKCDVEESEEIAAKYQITSIPTVVFLKADGEMATRLVGLQSKAKLEETINSLL